MATTIISFDDTQSWNTSLLAKNLQVFSHRHLPIEGKRFPNYSVLQNTAYSMDITYTSSKGTVKKSTARIYISSVANDEDFSNAEYCTDPIDFSANNTRVQSGDMSSYLFKNSSYNEDRYLNVRTYFTFSSAVSSRVVVDFKNRKVEITYLPPTVIVKAEVNGTGGTVSGGKTLTLTNADTEYSTTLTAMPNSGYKFVKWSDGNTNATRTVTYSDNDIAAHETTVTYTATFERRGYTLTVTAGEGGTVTGGGTYESGQTATITATPDNGYKFVKWSDGNTAPTRTITVTSDAVYTATFEPDRIKKIYTGNGNTDVYLGTSQLKEVYIGTKKIYG